MGALCIFPNNDCSNSFNRIADRRYKFMNGLTAKRLRQLALQLVISQGFSGGDGYNQYDQEANCVSWEPAYQDGHQHVFEGEAAGFVNAIHERMVDPDGTPLFGMFKNPGTLHHKHRVTIVYKGLKKLWMQTGGKHEIFGKNFRRTYRSYAPATA
jgi:hypothetical protein